MIQTQAMNKQFPNMKVLIYAMPRTKSTMLLSGLMTAGAQMLHEPFHFNPIVRNQNSSCQDQVWNGEEDHIKYLGRVLSNPFQGIKIHASHQAKKQTMRLFDWADLIIYPQRNLLEIACSFCVAVIRNKWNLEDKNPNKIIAKKEWVEGIVHWNKLFEDVKKEANHHNTIEIPWEQDFSETKTLLAERGVKIGTPKTQITRQVSPTEMISNLEELKSWLV